MENFILDNINNPKKLEEVYQKNEKEFKKAFDQIFPEIANTEIAKFWQARLEYEQEKESVSIKRKSGENNNLLNLLISIIISAVLIKLPDIFGFDAFNNAFYQNFSAIILFFGLSLYHGLNSKNFTIKKLLITIMLFMIPALFVHIIHKQTVLDDGITIALIHLPLMLWVLYGIVYTDLDLRNIKGRIEYIRYNGDLLIISAIIQIAGMILTGLTIGLFEIIGVKIEEFYFNYVVVIGLISIPLVSTYVIRKLPQIANKIAPVIANIFTPIVLTTLVIFLISMIVAEKDPYNDRDFLMVFNVLLIAVMGIIVFSVAGASHIKRQKFTIITLSILTLITVIIDLIALSAIIYRLGEYGFTPNRITVLASNLLILINLILFVRDFYKVNFRNEGLNKIEKTIAGYLPVYAIYTVIMVFLFPFVF